MSAPHESWTIPDPLAVDTCPCCGWPVESQRARPHTVNGLRVCGGCFASAKREGGDFVETIHAALLRRKQQREAA